jgi:hypothetical protein
MLHQQGNSKSHMPVGWCRRRRRKKGLKAIGMRLEGF